MKANIIPIILACIITIQTMPGIAFAVDNLPQNSETASDYIEEQDVVPEEKTPEADEEGLPENDEVSASRASEKALSKDNVEVPDDGGDGADTGGDDSDAGGDDTMEPLEDGSLEHPIVISSKEDLLQIDENLSAAYVLANDIDLAGSNFSAIAASNPFTGDFDGAGHTIKNFTYTTSKKNTVQVDAGLFARTSNANIHDLNISNVKIDVTVLKQSNKARIGIVSLSDSNSSFSNINVSGTVKADAYNVQMAGLINRAEGSTVSNIDNNLNMTLSSEGSSSWMGGIIGSVDTVSVSDCSMAGSLNSKDSKKTVTAGIISGARSTQDPKITIKSCTNNAKVESSYSSGGIASGIGVWDCLIDNCLNYGTIYGEKSASGIISNIGGGYGAVSNCKNYGSISASLDDANDYACGIGIIQKISSCTNEGTIHGPYIAGIGGNIVSSSETTNTIVDCVNKGEIQGYENTASGIGWADVFQNCVNYGNVSLASPDPDFSVAGGIGDVCYRKASNCYNYGNVKGATTAAGVITFNQGEISQCFNSGAIQAIGEAAGICVVNKDVIQDSYNNGSIIGKDACGISVNNNKYAVIIDCYNVGAIDGSNRSAGITVTNENNIIESYYYNGTATGVANNLKGAKNGTESLTATQLSNQDSYSGFDFAGDAENHASLLSLPLATTVYAEDYADNSIWVMSKKSGMPKLASMTDSQDVYIKSVAIKTSPKTTPVNKAIPKSKVKLTVTYSNNKKATIKAGYKFSSYKKTLGKRKITLNYVGKKLSFTTTFVPAKVGKFKLTAKKKKVVISIPKTAGAKKYQVYRSTKKKSGYKAVATTSKRKYTDKKKLKSKKKYYYKIRAINGSYKGAFSKVYSVKVK